MSEQQLRALFATWIDRLDLTHWTIEVAVEKIKPRTRTMETSKSPHYDRGRIVVQPWVIAGNPPSTWHAAPEKTFDRVVEETIVHELLHLLLWETTSAICLLASYTKTPAYETAFKVQEHQEENAVDRLSVALVNMAHAESKRFASRATANSNSRRTHSHASPDRVLGAS